MNEILYDFVMVVMTDFSRKYSAKYVIHRFSPSKMTANIHPV
jgi:hypothetical protein